jgi:hypothetical protein
MMFNAIFNNISDYRGGSFIAGENRSTRRQPPTFFVLNTLNNTNRLHGSSIYSISMITFSVSSNPVQARWMYSIQHYVINLVSDLQHVGGCRRVLRFSPAISINIVYSGFLR